MIPISPNIVPYVIYCISIGYSCNVKKGNIRYILMNFIQNLSSDLILKISKGRPNHYNCRIK